MLYDGHRGKHLLMSESPSLEGVKRVLLSCELPESTALRGAALCIANGYDADEISARALATVNALMNAFDVMRSGRAVGGGGDGLLHAFRPSFIVRGES